MEGVAVLGTFVPTVFDASCIKRELEDFIRSKGFTLNTEVDVRSPAWHDKNNKDWGSSNWHQDCGTKDIYLFIWSNEAPTQVMTVDEKPIPVDTCQVVRIDNLRFLHRKPKYKVPCNRWFARAYTFKED